MNLEDEDSGLSLIKEKMGEGGNKIGKEHTSTRESTRPLGNHHVTHG